MTILRPIDSSIESGWAAVGLSENTRINTSPVLSQPKNTPKINFANPITAGLVAYYMPGLSERDLVGNNHLVNTSGFGFSIDTNDYGVEYKLVGNNASRYTTADDSLKNEEVTLFWRGSLSAGSTADACLGGITHNSTNSSPYVSVELKRSHIGAHEDIFLFWSMGTQHYYAISSAHDYASGNYTIIATCKSGEQILYIARDNVLVEIAYPPIQISGTIAYTATSRIEIGDSLNARYPAASCLCMCVWDRALAWSEVFSIIHSPWSFVKGPVRFMDGVQEGYLAINEESPEDATYITSSTVGSVERVLLSSAALSSPTPQVRYRARRPEGSMDLKVQLIQITPTDPIVIAVRYPTLTTSFVDYTIDLDPATETSLITDYSQLAIEFITE